MNRINTTVEPMANERPRLTFSELDNLLKEVIEQAEGQYKDWPMEA